MRPVPAAELKGDSRPASAALLSPAETLATLESIARQCDDLASRLRSLTCVLHSGGDLFHSRAERGASSEEALVQSLIRLRRERDELFEPNLFADPAWDILLELYLADLEQRRVAISSACLAAAVPTTTALRTMGALVARGLVERHPYALDARVTHVQLTDAGRARMQRLIRRVSQALDPGGAP